MLITFGLDVARDGEDRSTLYARLWGTLPDPVWCVGEYRLSSDRGGLVSLAGKVREAAVLAQQQGCTRCHIRVDAVGVGGGCADILRADLDLSERFEEFRVIDVVANSTENLHDPNAYADRITELYAHAADELADVKLLDPPGELEEDLCGRAWKDAQRRGRWLKQLTSKDVFKKDYGRSPDHGDGCVMAIVRPEHLQPGGEVSFLTTAVLDAAIDFSAEWGSNYPTVCCGVDVQGAPFRISVVVRGVLPSGVTIDCEVAYIYEDHWPELLRVLLRTGAQWCVVNVPDTHWSEALDFAGRIRGVPAPGKHFRRTYLARQKGTDARPSWRDKPHRELRLKGEETGYKYVVDVHPGYVLQWSLDRWRDGHQRTPPPGDLWGTIPHCEGVPEPLLRPEDRREGGVTETCLGDVYRGQLLRSGLRGIEPVLPYGGGWVVAGAMADIGLERMQGG